MNRLLTMSIINHKHLSLRILKTGQVCLLLGRGLKEKRIMKCSKQNMVIPISPFAALDLNLNIIRTMISAAETKTWR